MEPRVRQRKKVKVRDGQDSEHSSSEREPETKTGFQDEKAEPIAEDKKVADEEVLNSSEDLQSLHWFTSTVSCMTGVAIMVILCYRYRIYIQTLHENYMWFSNIKVVFPGYHH